MACVVWAERPQVRGAGGERIRQRGHTSKVQGVQPGTIGVAGVERLVLVSEGTVWKAGKVCMTGSTSAESSGVWAVG